MSLEYLTIFNPSLGKTEETLVDQLLFYTSSATSNLDAQLRQIGLLQGIVELAKSFSEGQSVDYLESRDTRTYILRQGDYWIVLCLNVVSENGGADIYAPSAAQVHAELKVAYALYCLEHLSFNDTHLEAWWLKYAWSYDGTSDFHDSFDGYRVSTRRYDTSRIKEFHQACSSAQFVDLLVMKGDEYVYTGTVNTTAKRDGQRFVKRRKPREEGSWWKKVESDQVSRTAIHLPVDNGRLECFMSVVRRDDLSVILLHHDTTHPDVPVDLLDSLPETQPSFYSLVYDLPRIYSTLPSTLSLHRTLYLQGNNLSKMGQSWIRKTSDSVLVRNSSDSLEGIARQCTLYTEKLRVTYESFDKL